MPFMDSGCVEPIITAYIQEPGPEGRLIFLPIQVVDPQSLLPRLPANLLPEPIGVQMIDTKAQKRIPFRGYQPPPAVLLDAKEPGSLKLLARSAPVRIKLVYGRHSLVPIRPAPSIAEVVCRRNSRRFMGGDSE